MSKTFLSILLCLCVAATAQGSPLLSIEGKKFVNGDGAQVILRGYAIQAKMPPFRPVSAATDLDTIVDFGANVIRLHFSWEAAEPQPGVYDESYFSYYRQVVDWAAQRDIFVVVDFHNNAFSRWAAGGCGSGFPAWAISDAVTPVTPRENGDCDFLSEMGQAIFAQPQNFIIWRDFLTDAYGDRARFFALLSRLAADYRQHPAVIGFDVNEPLPYDPAAQTFDYDMMREFYEAMASVVHAVDPGMFIFVEPFLIDHVFINQVTPYDKPLFANAVYAPHLYEFGSLYLGVPILSHFPNLLSIVQSREKLEIPVLIGEWGSQLSGYQSVQDQIHLINRDFDVHALSATRWNYSPNWTPQTLDNFHDEDYSCFDDQRNVRPGCAPRAFVKQIAGQMQSLRLFHAGEPAIFSPQYPGVSDMVRSTITFVDFSWQHDPAKGDTIIFAPVELLFGQSPTIAAFGAACAYDAARRHVTCSSSQAGLKRVVIYP